MSINSQPTQACVSLVIFKDHEYKDTTLTMKAAPILALKDYFMCLL